MGDIDKQRRALPRVAIVAGLEQTGIGSAAAVRLAQEGMDVAVLGPDGDAGAATVRQIAALGGRAVAIGTDVTDAASVDTALVAVRASLGDPQVLVNIVAAGTPGPLSELSEDDWYASTGARLRAVFLVSRAVIDPMTSIGSGRIVTIAGPAAAGEQENATLRAGLAGFTRTIALDLGAFGITSAVIAAAVEATGPGYPAQVIATLSFLLGDAATALSGQVVQVGAGA
jgi:3-oxoacyl-[acyl-carrier protein] reductase